MPDLSYEERRLAALDKAIQVTQFTGVGATGVVETAREFLEFIEGDED